MCQLPPPDALAPLRRVIVPCDELPVRFELECRRDGPDELMLRCFAINDGPEWAVVDANFLVMDTVADDAAGAKVSVTPQRRSIYARMKPAARWVGLQPGLRVPLEELSCSEYSRSRGAAQTLSVRLLIRSPGRKPLVVHARSIPVLPPAA